MREPAAKAGEPKSSWGQVCAAAAGE